MDESQVDSLKVKLLFVGNEQLSLQLTFAFLQKRGWGFKFVNSVKEAINIIPMEKPTHVFLSWNLNQGNIPKVEQAIRKSFRIPCVVYTEQELDPKTQHALVASGVKNFILVPITGTHVTVKVRALLMEVPETFEEAESEITFIKGEQIKIETNTRVEIKTLVAEEIKSFLDNISEAAEWERLFAEKGKPRWSLKSDKGDKILIFKGDSPPIRDSMGFRFHSSGTLERHEMDSSGKMVVVEQKEISTAIPDDRKIIASKKKSKLEAKFAEIFKELEPEKPQSSLEPAIEKTKKPGEKNKAKKSKSLRIPGVKERKSHGMWDSAIAVRGDVAGIYEKIEVSGEAGGRRGSETLYNSDSKNADIETSSKILRAMKSANKPVTEGEQVSISLAATPEPVVFTRNAQEEGATWKVEKESQLKKSNYHEISANERDDRTSPKQKKDAFSEESSRKEKFKLMKFSQEASKEQTHRFAQSEKNEKKTRDYVQKGGNTKRKFEIKKGEALKPLKIPVTSKPLPPEQKARFRVKSKKSNRKLEAAEKRANADPALQSNKNHVKGGKRQEFGPPKLKEQKLSDTEARRHLKNSKNKKEDVAPTDWKLEEDAGIKINPSEEDVFDMKPEKEQRPSPDAPILTNFEGNTKLFGKNQDTVLAKSVADSVNAAMKEASSQHPKIPLNLVTHLDCIPINSRNFKGLLIFATSAPQHCGAAFSREIKNQIMKQMSNSGEIMADEGVLELQVSPFVFFDVAAEIGEFVTITENNGVELGMTFIRATGVIPQIRESVDKSMLEVDMNEISPDAKIDFDAYIHLPVNNKYIKYVRKGGSIEARQISNMTEYNMNSFFIKQKDVQQFKGHYVTAFVEKIVREFLDAVNKRSA